MEKVIEENPAAAEWLPENKPDGSGIGVNYVDAFLKPLNCELEDEVRLACKRRGLKITVSVGDRKGEAILRRIENGPDVRAILHAALTEAFAQAGAKCEHGEGNIRVEY
ncbi:MAG: hypothetical protein VYB66_05780 [Verrucomicrobiota bacterium]|nr:hypothetical protein [Verrucomicrobiota bacterium]|tara:strand:- start:67 stop:393 length:327 start_codon:yes stop_codon:yes gene_type:complete